jgi:hypothetical protein
MKKQQSRDDLVVIMYVFRYLIILSPAGYEGYKKINCTGRSPLNAVKNSESFSEPAYGFSLLKKSEIEDDNTQSDDNDSHEFISRYGFFEKYKRQNRDADISQ